MGYESLLNSEGFLPSFPEILGRTWSAATASEIRANMPHCVMEDPELKALRFEIKNTSLDYSPDGRRRSEISTVEEQDQQAHNGVAVWNSYLFRMPVWADRVAMKNKLGSTAMCISQLKPNSGGSPTRAHRITGDGFFRATTTSDPGSDNVKRYTGSVRIDDGQVHRIVERIIPHPTAGRWELWLDGQKIVNFSGAMGASTGGYSPSFGIYSSSGIGCDISIEYADIRILSATSLDSLINDRNWPVAAPVLCPACQRPL